MKKTFLFATVALALAAAPLVAANETYRADMAQSEFSRATLAEVELSRTNVADVELNRTNVARGELSHLTFAARSADDGVLA